MFLHEGLYAGVGDGQVEYAHPGFGREGFVDPDQACVACAGHEGGVELHIEPCNRLLVGDSNLLRHVTDGGLQDLAGVVDLLLAGIQQRVCSGRFHSLTDCIDLPDVVV